MRRIITLALATILAVSCFCIIGLADEGKVFKGRGYLLWGMNVDEVYTGLRNEKHYGINVCTELEKYRSYSDDTVMFVSARAKLGNYTPRMYCYVSNLWGLFRIEYDFKSIYALSDEDYQAWKSISNEDLISEYGTIERLITYVYAQKGERIIEKVDQIDELKDNYYIIRTCWTIKDDDRIPARILAKIYLACYRSSGVYHIDLEYDSPDSGVYDNILELDLKVTSTDMFYGF